MARQPQAEQSLKAWYQEAEKETWHTMQDVKAFDRRTSVLSSRRVVFNIKGNHFRLIVDIDFKTSWLLIIWVGTHAEYDKIDARTVVFSKNA